MSDRVLIVDDDPAQRRLLEAAVQRMGFSALAAAGGKQALAIASQVHPGKLKAVILDLMMPGMDGLEVMGKLRASGVYAPVIVQTAKGGIETVVSAMRAGAFDFVVKPVSPERLARALGNALKVEKLEASKKDVQPKGAAGFTVKDIITESPAMERVLRLCRKAATSNIPVLIEGESGVGKELIARAIRGESNRRSKPFVTVNCGAIPHNLVESILFGHEKGAFTGASDKHRGKFLEAHEGTLFLDEIGELPPEVQVKLLRAVQEGEVDPVGANSPQRVDIRLISATNRDLLAQVRDGQFREDLYYRLNVFPIMVPPLRERKEDISVLVQHFISRFSDAVTGPGVKGISQRALSVLAAYDWPGNIRQLENAVFRAMVLCEGHVLTAEDFPQILAQVEGIEELVADEEVQRTNRALQTGTSSVVPIDGDEPAAATQPLHPGLIRAIGNDGNVRPLEEVEAEMIRFAIAHYGGQMSEVARRLGIGRSTLYRKLKELGIDGGRG
ncbi:sigma-54-dependent transcriptional regulator [Nitratireductor basaltis]|uniref:DNA-binding transcriptional regulator NtrC n=1 Tax=Nitratireductor basaltis TaxID=472175 RepID=A0A084U853_9HYPH|nr:sigma-54 dependent transcriptional regulator [Nitratireductor basaltis]KFB09139.1 Two component, sigma54 specific, transcriptional regulator, Fis family [Nitratireductor basaltis]